MIEPYRLLTSVAIPCYDTRINKMNDTRTAYLLGVAATDVPIDEFERITVPYKVRPYNKLDIFKILDFVDWGQWICFYSQ